MSNFETVRHALCCRHALLAEAPIDPEMEITAGSMIAGLLVMVMMVASLVSVVVWIVRYNNGLPVLPAARRKPLKVPFLLMVSGVLLSALMLLMVHGSPEEVPTAAQADDAVLSTDETTEAEAGDPAEEGQAVVDESRDSSEGNNVVNEAVGSSDEIADGSGQAADKATATGDEEKPKQYTEAEFMGMILSTLVMNSMIFAVFGLTIVLFQQLHSRRMSHPNDLSYDDQLFQGSLTQEHPADHDPYQPPEIIPSAQNEPPNPFIEQSLADDRTLPAEPWVLTKELRFAAETFLVAYLPTTIMRIIISVLAPEAPSHPFLEMMDQGISLPMGLLIAFTAVVVAPVVEELHYRVAILGGLMQQRSLIAGWIISSVMFGLVHGLTDGIALLPLAFAIGYAYIRRRSYRTVVLIHFLFNAFNMAIAGLAML